jgi:hypothetical protein
MKSMFNVKTITLITALAGLASPSQAWAMNDENPDTAGPSIAPKPPALDINDTDEKPSDIIVQKQAAQAENEKLEAQIAAAKAEAAATKAKQELEAEQLKTAQLQAQLAALQAAQSTPTPTPASKPDLDPLARLEKNVTNETAKFFDKTGNFLKKGKFKKSKKKYK